MYIYCASEIRKRQSIKHSPLFEAKRQKNKQTKNKNRSSRKSNMWSIFFGYLHCLIVLLLFGGQLNAFESNFVSSPSTPLSNVDTLAAQSPLTEDNFTSVFPIVCFADGCIEGRATPGFQIDEYESFFAIPYAEPPVGKLRFAVRKSCNFIII